MKRQGREIRTPIATEMYLPNLSGDHSKGRVRVTPTTDLQIANKKYVDDQIAASAHTPEGTAVLSTGEAAGTKFLREDGDGTSSWQAPSGGVTDHGALTGLGDDDHTQYLLKAGGTMTGQIVLGANTAVSTEQSGTGDGTTTIDWDLGPIYFHTFGAQNETFTFSPAGSNAATVFHLFLKQDSTGSRTVTWPSTVKFPSDTDPVLSTGANAVDIISFIQRTPDGVEYYGSENLNY